MTRTFRVETKGGTLISEGASPLAIVGLAPGVAVVTGDYVAVAVEDGVESIPIDIPGFTVLPEVIALTAPVVEMTSNMYNGTAFELTTTNDTEEPTFVIYDTDDSSEVVSGASPLTITGLTQGNTYETGRFIAVEVVGEEESPATDILEFRVPYQIYPPEVESVVPTDTTATITMISGNGIDGSTYHLYEADGDELVLSSTSPFELTGLEPETTYPEGTWYVTEQTGDGETDAVNVPEFTTLATEEEY